MMTQPDDASSQPENPVGPDGLSVLIRQALFILEPFFMDGADGNATYARAAAKEILVSYQVGSAIEIQLATECIVLAYSAMETLREAKIDQEIPVTIRLRLRNSGASLNRASQRTRRSLDTLHKFRNTAPESHTPAPRKPGPPTPAPHTPESPPGHSKVEPHLDPTGIMPELQEKIAQHRERMAAARAQAAHTPSPSAPAPPASVHG